MPDLSLNSLERRPLGANVHQKSAESSPPNDRDAPAWIYATCHSGRRGRYQTLLADLGTWRSRFPALHDPQSQSAG